MTAGPARRAGGAAFVAAGILISRIFGLVRNRLIGRFLGTGDAADALIAALRIPNVLQNLFGEGVLSASFIPVYARLVAEGNEEEAGRVAGAVGVLLVMTSSVLVLVGILLAPVAIPLIAGGFTGEKRELTVLLVQIVFPGVGLLVLSAWALGVLNSHRRFFLSYVSPVAMNLVMIGALVRFGPAFSTTSAGQAHLVTVLAWASVVGSGAQLAVQLPTLWRVERRLRLGAAITNPRVRTVLSNFAPVVMSRGIVQVSGWIDGLIASFVSTGAFAMLGYAQVITMLPVSLFGMSVSAAELPAMSGEMGEESVVAAALRRRLQDGLRRIAFYVVPSALAFLALGDIVGGTLYESGAFARGQTVWLWSVLAGSSVGLLAGTLARLYASTWYALRNTRTPLLFAVVRVTLGIALGVVGALRLPRWLGLDPQWGVAGLTAASGVAAWVEFALLRRSLNRRLGPTGPDFRYLCTLWLCAVLAALPAWGAKLALGVERPLVLGAVALSLYGAVYFAATAAFGIAEARDFRGRFARLLGGA